MQGKNEDGVQQDIGHRADEHRPHADLGKALGGDEAVEAQGHLDENGADGVDAHVIHGVGNGVLTGAKGQQQILAPQEKHRRQHSGDAHLKGKAAAQDFFRRVMVLLPHVNGSPGRAAGGHQGRKGGNDQNQRQAHAHAGKGQVPVPGNVADVNAVHDVVEHVHQLGDDCGHRQLPQKLSNGLRTQKCFILIHVTSPCMGPGGLSAGPYFLQIPRSSGSRSPAPPPSAPPSAAGKRPPGLPGPVQ